ncbi:MAG: UPF0262 family protein [Alphaproteobacteria bacterium]
MAQTKAQEHTNTISSVSIVNMAPPSSSLLAQDRKIAIRDLERVSFFKPLKNAQGPYALTLFVQDNRLVIEMENINGEPIPMLVLSLKPYKRLIQDYFMIVQSYDQAIQSGRHARIEAIDMSRRGIHNEGAELLLERLKDKIELDFDTARRLFTLICALQESKALLWR